MTTQTLETDPVEEYFSNGEQKALSVVVACSASVSLCCSTLLIISYLSFKGSSLCTAWKGKFTGHLYITVLAFVLFYVNHVFVLNFFNATLRTSKLFTKAYFLPLNLRRAHIFRILLEFLDYGRKLSRQHCCVFIAVHFNSILWCFRNVMVTQFRLLFFFCTKWYLL